MSTKVDDEIILTRFLKTAFDSNDRLAAYHDGLLRVDFAIPAVDKFADVDKSLGVATGVLDYHQQSTKGSIKKERPELHFEMIANEAEHVDS